MYTIKFCKGPQKIWVGVTEYNGGHEFATGRTLDMLVKHLKNNMSVKHGVSARQAVLDTKQMDAYEFEKLYKPFMTPIFKGRYWVDKNKGEYTELATTQPATLALPPRPQTKKAGEYITEIDGEELVVYELREVARYKLHGASGTNQPNKNTDSDLPVCTADSESQEENIEF